LSNILTAEILAHCFTKPLPKHTFFEVCAAMRMIRIGLGNDLGNKLGALGNGIGNGIGIGIGNGFVNAIGKQID
jgi:hypothetical protein